MRRKKYRKILIMFQEKFDIENAIKDGVYTAWKVSIQKRLGEPEQHE